MKVELQMAYWAAWAYSYTRLGVGVQDPTFFGHAKFEVKHFLEFISFTEHFSGVKNLN